MVTVLLPEESVGKWICTPPHSSMTDRIKRPFAPINELWSLDSIERDSSTMLALNKMKL